MAGLTTTQFRVLAVVSRAPLGVVSAREIARRAAMSPTAVARAVSALEDRGLLVRKPGLDKQQRLLFNWEHPESRVLRPALGRIVLPKRAVRDGRVPRRLRHLFWNTAASQLDVEAAGPYIATRLLRTLDPEGLAWGARTLSHDDWTAGARARGLSPQARALARNIAEVRR